MPELRLFDMLFLHQTLSFAILLATKIAIVVIENVRHAATACCWCGAVLLENASSLRPVPLEVVELLEGFPI